MTEAIDMTDAIDIMEPEQVYNRLLTACKQGDTTSICQIFTELLNEINKLNVSTSYFLEHQDWMNLYAAVKDAMEAEGHEGLLDQFIDASIKIACPDDLLCFAAKIGDLKLAQRAVDLGADNGEISSTYAAENGNKEILDWITSSLNDGEEFDECRDLMSAADAED